MRVRKSTNNRLLDSERRRMCLDCVHICLAVRPLRVLPFLELTRSGLQKAFRMMLRSKPALRSSAHAGTTTAVSRPVHTAQLISTPAMTEPATASTAQDDIAKMDPTQALAALAKAQAGTASGTEASIAAVATQVLMSDPETAAQLKRYQEAVARVEAAKAAAKELEDMYAKAGRDMAISQAQQEAETRKKADEVMAAAEVAAAEKLLRVAELEAALAEQQQQRFAQQANQDADRVESVKAGLVAAVGGAASTLPLLVVSSFEQGLTAALTLAGAVASSFLFGVTYRYAVRGDVDNSHLRSGAVGAFGLVRAAAGGDMLQATSTTGPLDIATVIGPAALYAGESMIMFAFASAAVEVAFRQGFVQRFGVPKQPAPQ